MRRVDTFAASLFLLGAIRGQVLADTWCSTTFPGAVFCDDFDGYADWFAFENAWVPTGGCGSPLALDGDFTVSPPWAGKMNTQQNGDLGYSVNAITSSIRNAFGSACTSGAVIGTDLNPLVLEAVMIGGAKAKYDNSFLTLASGFAFAPTDWAYSDWCSAGCGSPKPHYPVICQQETPTAGCPPIGAASPMPAIAAGFLAYLDNNPCHCGESGDQSPYNEHLSFFDGNKWYRLRQGLFTGSGDFRLQTGENRIKITIKSATLKVELTTPDTGEYSWCQLGGGYTGPFGSLATGFHRSCELKPGEWVCRNDPGCRDAVGVPNGGVPRYDNIVLHGGICSAAPGACCMSNTSCLDARYGGDCQTLGGSPAAPGSTCAATACCPPLPADHDMDGDVDVEDFGWFQTCLSSAPYAAPPTLACQCADLDHDGDVDVDDFTVFSGCLLGPGIPATPNCAP